MTTVITRVENVWNRFIAFIDALNQREVNAWGASLQYKRRYTNPDMAKLSRRMP